MTGEELLAALPPPFRGALTDEQALASLLDMAYGEPGRHYHSLTHVRDGLRELESALASLPHAPECGVAFLFHDAVYDVTRKDSEERSAALFAEWAGAVCPGVDRSVVTRLIRLTAHHGGISRAELTEEERLFLDADLSVLGGSREGYRAYAEGVRLEFEPHVGPMRYVVGRKTFLAKLLASPRIFLSDRFRDRLEERARANVRGELLGFK